MAIISSYNYSRLLAMGCSRLILAWRITVLLLGSSATSGGRRRVVLLLWLLILLLRLLMTSFLFWSSILVGSMIVVWKLLLEYISCYLSADWQLAIHSGRDVAKEDPLLAARAFTESHVGLFKRGAGTDVIANSPILVECTEYLACTSCVGDKEYKEMFYIKRSLVAVGLCILAENGEGAELLPIPTDEHAVDNIMADIMCLFLVTRSLFDVVDITIDTLWLASCKHRELIGV